MRSIAFLSSGELLHIGEVSEIPAYVSGTTEEAYYAGISDFGVLLCRYFQKSLSIILQMDRLSFETGGPFPFERDKEKR